MNSIVFATYDITPELWADFAQIAGVSPGENADPNAGKIVPWALIYSRSQTDAPSSTESIPHTIKTELASATSSELRTLCDQLCNASGSQSFPDVFSILDQQSEKDRKIVFVHQASEWVNKEGEIDLEGPWGREEECLRERTVWRRHRVPFEKAFFYQAMLTAMPGNEGDEFLEETEKEWKEDVSSTG